MPKLVRFILTTLLRTVVVLSIVGTLGGGIFCIVEGLYYWGVILLALLFVIIVGAVTYDDFYTGM